MNAYLLSHTGLGDNITMISAIRFLGKFYQKIYFLCKDCHQENVRLFFNDSVTVIPFDKNHEFLQCYQIINKASAKDDILICGYHKRYIASRITNSKLLEYKKNNEHTTPYSFIKDFYDDAGLDLYIYYYYFDISSTELSCKLYEQVKNYKIAFFHTQASNIEINLEHIMSTFAQNSEYIVICANKNVYKDTDEKHAIASQYVNIKIAYYIDIIKSANVIHVVDSCFSCIVSPLQYTKSLKASECVIHSRN